MVASTDIKWFTSDNLNAPQLNNDWGVMIGVLDACLINGFSVQTVASLTATGAIATATFNSAHQYKQYQVIEISGAGQNEYNGQARILTVPNANSITFELASAPSANTATGSITCKLPALDWEKPFGDTGQKAAYRSKNTLLASRPFLRVDNSLDPAYTTTYAKYAKVGIVEQMTDIDTLLGVQAPYDAANPTKNWVGTGSGTSVINGWAKWYHARANDAGVNGNQLDSTPPSLGNRAWMIIGNTDFFYLLPAVASLPNQVLYGFGAFESLINPDNANNFLACSDYSASAGTSSSPALGTGLHATTTSNGASSNLLVQRKYDGSLVHNNARAGAFGQMNGSFYSGSSNYITVFNSDFIFSPVFILDQVATSGSQLVMRGKVPLLHWLYNNRPYADKFIFTKGAAIYMAKDIVTSGSTMGQVVLQIGSL